MRAPPWLQSLIPRLRSLRNLLSQSLSLLRPCPRRPRTRQPQSEEAARPAAKTSRSPRRRCRPKRSQHRLPSPLRRLPLPRAQPEASPRLPSLLRRFAKAPEPAPEPVPQPVRMTPAQERALRYMQRQDRYMELLARNTHEL